MSHCLDDAAMLLPLMRRLVPVAPGDTVAGLAAGGRIHMPSFRAATPWCWTAIIIGFVMAEF